VLNHIKYIYFLGIGGIGMSALARYFNAAGKTVYGYDKTETALTDELQNEGIKITFNETIEALPPELVNGQKANTLIIYTPAIPRSHQQYNYFVAENYTMEKRSVVLGWITSDVFTIAVAGTHGKTTTSCIITHLLKSAGINCTAFLGGISTNYNTNFISGNVNANDAVIVVEADEFDRSFLTLHPDISVITSMDADHLDIYGDKVHLEESYRLFAGQLKAGGFLFARAGLQLDQNETTHTYSISSNADFKAENIRINDHKYYFDLAVPGEMYKDLSLGLPGRHNVENAVAAIAVALNMGIHINDITHALQSFTGVKRRFEYHVNNMEHTYIDDYAHHPEELRATISSVKELYSDKKITGIFQPHLYSRTRDFADGFAKSLSLLDALLLLDIYPARELPLEGITSAVIYDKVTIKDKMMCAREDLPAIVKSRNPEVLLTLGAGDIDQLVEPLKEILS
jgi:UDP-N-acetylmuramate--alanine ligase